MALTNILLALVWILSFFGILIILYGTFITIRELVDIELNKKKKFIAYEHAKRIFVQKLIFALDFFIAADLISIFVVSNRDGLIKLAIIVIIRTTLSYFLGKEIHLHKE